MRRLLRLAVVFGVALVAASCVLSVDPVIPESDATFDARLVGAWQEVPGSDYSRDCRR